MVAMTLLKFLKDASDHVEWIVDQRYTLSEDQKLGQRMNSTGRTISTAMNRSH